MCTSCANFCTLNDYCLAQIRSYLSMKDQLNLAATCSRFRTEFQLNSSQFNKIQLLLNISTHEFKLLSLVYENVKELSIDIDDLMSSLAKNYTNHETYFFNGFCKLLAKMHRLESVHLWQYNTTGSSGEKLLRALHNLNNLKHLQISLEKCGTRALRSLPKLETFTLDLKLSSRDLLKSYQYMDNLHMLHLTPRVEISGLRKVIYFCPQLRELSFHIKPRQSIWNCSSGQRPVNLAKIFHALAEETKYLESLTVKGIITELKDAEHLAGISSLRFLTCEFSNADCVWALRKLSLLEELRISYMDDTDISEIYLNLIRTCTHLRLLNIFDFNIYEGFVVKVHKVLKELERKHPLVLVIYGHRDSTILRVKPNIDTTRLLYHRMTAQELLKIL